MLKRAEWLAWRQQEAQGRISRVDDILKVAMPKGRIYKQASKLFIKAGLAIPEDLEDTRKLIIPVPEARMEFILAKPVDVPTYVEYGVADIGVVGKDVLMEENRNVYELLDLGIARCRMSVIGLPDWQPVLNPRVATKYPNVASQYFRELGQQVEVIKLNGSIELAPLIGLADRIVDMVETGQTLRENGLEEQEEIFQITSRLIANRVSYRLKNEAIQHLCDLLQDAIPVLKRV
jgi:ATP phosphoribosyltransferase